MLQAGRSRVPLPMGVIDFFNTPNPSRRLVAPVFTQPVTEMSTEIFLEVKRGRRVKLTA
jgi:hypothetical protein